MTLRELALFAGIGGGLLGSRLCGWSPCCAVEIDPYCRRVLLARQADGSLPRFPVWDDIRTFDAIPWRGQVDIVTAGWPCQDLSSAGTGDGLNGARSGLWREAIRVVAEVGPRTVFLENSPILLMDGGLGHVLGELAELGYDAEWRVLGAHHAGAPHKRHRVWLVAHSRGRGLSRGRPQPACSVPGARRKAQTWWSSEPGVCRVDNGLPDRVERLTAIGNGQVPAVVELAWSTRSLGTPGTVSVPGESAL